MNKVTWVAVLIVATLVAVMVTGCDLFIADGDDSTGINAASGYFYLMDNDSERLLSLDQNMNLVHSWPYSDFTSESFVQGMTYDGDALWVSVSGSDDNLYRLDLSSDTDISITKTLQAPPDGQGTVQGIAWDGEVLWVLNSGSTTYRNPPELFQIDPSDGTILSRYELPSADPQAICFVGPNSDVYGFGATEGCYYTDSGDDFVHVFETDRLTFLSNEGFPAPVGPRGENYVYPAGIFFDGKRFWTINSSGVADYLFALDYEGKQTQRVDLPFEQPGALVWVNRDLRQPGPPVVLVGYLWFLDGVNDVLYLYSISEKEILQSYDTAPVAPGGSLQGLAYDGTDLWLSAGGTDDIIAKLDTTGGVLSIAHLLSAPPEGEGTVRDMAFDGTDLWVPNSTTDEIYRVSTLYGDILDTIPTPGGEPRGVTWANGKLYCNDKDLDAVYVWDEASSSWSLAFEAPTPPGGTTSNRFPTGLTWDGVNFWMNNSTNEFDYIFQIAPDGRVLGTIAFPDRGPAQPTGLVFTLN